MTNTLFRAAQLWPRHPSVVWGERRFTWSETLPRVLRAASGLARLGAGPGERVAVLARNGVELFELSYAVPITGAAFTPFNTRLAAPELAHLAADSAPTILAYDAAHAAAVAALRPRLPSRTRFVSWGGDGGHGGATPYETLVAENAPIEPVPLDADAPWGVIYTGGTTGLPKGVVLSRQAMTANVAAILAELDWGTQPRFLQTTPLFHLAGLGPSYAVTAWGGTHYIPPAHSTELFIDSVERFGITASALVPTMIARLVDHPQLSARDLSSLEAMGYGASAIAEPVLRKLMHLYPRLRLTQFYGQTEVCGGLTVLAPSDHDLQGPDPARLRSAGRPSPHVRLKIIDAEGVERPRGEWGEIVGQSDGVFSGYLNHPEQTARALRNGWVHTGDVGYLDEAGYLFVTDRLKDMIVTGGENVSSSEVESVLLQHSEIAQAAVLGRPDRAWGEQVHAVVVVRNRGAISEADVIAFCQGRIASYKRPKTVEITDEPLPLSGVGKVRKDLLRAWLRAPDEETTA